MNLINFIAGILREHAANWQADRIIPTIIFSMIIPALIIALLVAGGYLLHWRLSANQKGGEDYE